MTERDNRWTLWAMTNDIDCVIPYQQTFERLEDAAVEARSLVDRSRGSLAWLKVFRSADENDVRARWSPADGWTKLSRTARAILDTAT